MDMSAVLLLLVLNPVHSRILLTWDQEVAKVKLREALTFYCVGGHSLSRGVIGIRRNGVTLFGCSDGRGSDPRYRFNCRRTSNGMFFLQVLIPGPSMTDNEHRSEWECLTMYGDDEQATGETIRIDVLVAVEEVSIINSPSNLTAMTELSELTCSAKNSRPAAVIDWFIDGEMVYDYSLITSTTSGNGTQRYTTQSSLKLTGKANKRYQTIHCESRNLPEKSSVTSESVTVEVLYNPGESPTIQGYISGFRLLTTDPPLMLSCKIRKNWPLPTLHWSCPHITELDPVTYTEEHVVSKIKINISIDLDGQRCVCIVTQSVKNFSRSTSVKFAVLSNGFTKRREQSLNDAIQMTSNNTPGIVTLVVGLILCLTALTTLIIFTGRGKCNLKTCSQEARGTTEHQTNTTTGTDEPSYEAIDTNDINEVSQPYSALSPDAQ